MPLKQVEKSEKRMDVESRIATYVPKDYILGEAELVMQSYV